MTEQPQGTQENEQPTTGRRIVVEYNGKPTGGAGVVVTVEGDADEG